MMTDAPEPADSLLGKKNVAFLAQLLGRSPGGGVALRLWDGSVVLPPGVEAAGCTIVLHTVSALTALLLRPNALGLGEAYVHGLIDIEGDIGCLARAGGGPVSLKARAAILSSGFAVLLRIGRRMFRAGAAFAAKGGVASRARVRRSIEFHYDQPVEFWKLWLDPLLQYTCAYYRQPGATVDQAQADKLEYICRKLRLEPGERLLDIGCGWGGLMRLAAVKFGCRASGVTLSRSQYDHVREWIAAEKQEENIEVSLTDFRDLTGAQTFDKIAGIGVIEHVGRKLQRAYFQRAYHLLRPGGLMINQGITRNLRYGHSAGKKFVERYVFPGARLLSVDETIRAAEKAGFIIRDVEALSEHYLPTLRTWRERLEENQEKVVKLVGPPTYRVFRFYLAGFEAAFEARKFGLYQSVFEKPGSFQGPYIRDSLYTASHGTDRFEDVK